MKFQPKNTMREIKHITSLKVKSSNVQNIFSNQIQLAKTGSQKSPNLNSFQFKNYNVSCGMLA